MNQLTMEKTYSVQEVVEETGLPADTLRYYERIGLLHPIQRNSSGHRAYTEYDLGWVYWLKLLRSSGMPIKMVQEYVQLVREGDDSIEARCEILSAHRQQLRDHIAELQGYLAVLDKKIDFYQGLELPD